MRTRSIRWLLGSSALGTALAVALGMSAGAPSGAPAPGSAKGERPAGYVLDHRLDDIDGRSVELARYAGRVLLLVNVASKCGYTPQYEGLEALYARYRERGFEVLGFPANDFGAQEPGSNAEIKEFCRATWGVRFPMFAKIHVRGPETHPLYAELSALPEPLGGEVAWNFQKYLVGRDGTVRAKFLSRVTPEDPELVAQIERVLAESD